MWIELIQQQDTIRAACCENVISLAEMGRCELWTSTFTLAEVYKRKCGNETVGLPEEQDTAFEDYIEKEHIRKIQVDLDVGKVARRLLRKFPQIGKPQDAIHVASCLLYNIDELHTFDREDLLRMDLKLDRFDRRKLKICQPPYPQSSPQIELFESDTDETSDRR